VRGLGGILAGLTAGMGRRGAFFVARGGGRGCGRGREDEGAGAGAAAKKFRKEEKRAGSGAVNFPKVCQKSFKRRTPEFFN